MVSQLYPPRPKAPPLSNQSKYSWVKWGGYGPVSNTYELIECPAFVCEADKVGRMHLSSGLGTVLEGTVGYVPMGCSRQGLATSNSTVHSLNWPCPSTGCSGLVLCDRVRTYGVLRTRLGHLEQHGAGVHVAQLEAREVDVEDVRLGRTQVVCKNRHQV